MVKINIQIHGPPSTLFNGVWMKNKQTNTKKCAFYTHQRAFTFPDVT